jgi:hypothetical protein
VGLFVRAVSDDATVDAFANLNEYLAGTLPLDSNSVLRIESVSTGAGNFELSWIGGVHSTQFIESCTALTTNTVWAVVATNLPPTAVSNVWNTAVSTEDESSMFRIKAFR